MDKKSMNSDNGIEEMPPEKPRKINKDLPEDIGKLTDTAKLSKDSRNQYFVRFPKSVAEALDLESVDKIEFIVKTPLPSASPEEAKLSVRLIRK